MLDFFFAQWFFVYPNLGATLGIPAPALGRYVPVEEYIFYHDARCCEQRGIRPGYQVFQAFH
jgi:hypothetical protein